MKSLNFVEYVLKFVDSTCETQISASVWKVWQAED